MILFLIFALKHRMWGTRYNRPTEAIFVLSKNKQNITFFSEIYYFLKALKLQYIA